MLERFLQSLVRSHFDLNHRPSSAFRSIVTFEGAALLAVATIMK